MRPAQSIWSLLKGSALKWLPGLVCASFAQWTFAVDEEVIHLDTPTGTIEGSLTLPDAMVAPRVGLPLALIIAGSGPTDRNGNTAVVAGRNDSLKQLAIALADLGIASIRYDKRGIGASAAAARSEAALRLETYVDDAVAWLRRAEGDRRFAGTVVVGHSEGALIGLLAARRGPAAAYVSIAGPAVPAGALFRRQLVGKLPPELARSSDGILALLELGRTSAVVPSRLEALYRPSVQPYLISWFRHDPAVEIAGLTLPCLIVQGESDLQVPVEDARALQRANPACNLALLPGTNHVLKQVDFDPDRQWAAYVDPSLPLAPTVTASLSHFLKHAGEARGRGPVQASADGLDPLDQKLVPATRTILQ